MIKTELLLPLPVGCYLCKIESIERSDTLYTRQAILHDHVTLATTYDTPRTGPTIRYLFHDLFVENDFIPEESVWVRLIHRLSATSPRIFMDVANMARTKAEAELPATNVRPEA